MALGKALLQALAGTEYIHGTRSGHRHGAPQDGAEETLAGAARHPVSAVQTTQAAVGADAKSEGRQG